MAKKDFNRPILLSIVAVLSILAGIVLIIAGALLLAGSTYLAISDVDLGLLAGAGSAGILIMGILYAVVGFALMSGKTWAWWLSVILIGLNLILSLYGMDIVGVVISALILIYLTRPNTRGWFEV